MFEELGNTPKSRSPPADAVFHGRDVHGVRPIGAGKSGACEKQCYNAPKEDKENKKGDLARERSQIFILKFFASLTVLGVGSEQSLVAPRCSGWTPSTDFLPGGHALSCL